MFVWEKNALSKEQEDAVLEKGSVLLIACPGSGKTRTLTYKIAYELDNLVSDKQFIIAITYTNAAADEIKERVETLGVNTEQLWIGTIHSFCLEWILKPYALYLDELKSGFKILNSHESEVIFTELCKHYKQLRITYYDCNYFATITGYELSCLDEYKITSLQNILSDYHEKLKNSNQIDFEQILYYSHKLLAGIPAISAILSKLFPFILIDEFQDTKEIQYHIIASIISAGKGLTKTFIVGDPNQSIYNTLGGYPMPQAEMENLFGFKMEKMELSSNYRSSGKIILYFDYYKTFENLIFAEGKDSDYESEITYNKTINVRQLEDEIVRLILLNIGKGILPNEICIAAPQWIPLAGLTRSLMVKLPDYSFDGPGMAPFSRDIDNFWFKVSRLILTEPSPDIYIRRLRWAKEVLNDLSFAGADVSTITNKSLLKLCNSIELNETEGLEYLEKAFQIIFSTLKINALSFELLSEHYISFFSSSIARIERLKKEGNAFIGSIINFRKVFKQREGIKISTIHGVKGTEFDVVIGFGLLDSWVPHFSDVNGFNNSKKMLYVLASRARKNLHLISETGRNINYYNPEGLFPTGHLLDYQYQYD